MITQLHIENYRGIKSLDMTDLKPVNILTGRNNSGKTSVLEAITLASCTNAMQLLQLEAFRSPNLITTPLMEPLQKMFFQQNFAKGATISGLSTTLWANKNTESFKTIFWGGYEFDHLFSLEPLNALNTTEKKLGKITFDKFIGSREDADQFTVSVEDKKWKSSKKQSYETHPLFVCEFFPANFKNIPEWDDLKELVIAGKEAQISNVLRIFDPNINGITIVGDDVMIRFKQPPLQSLGMMGDGVIRTVLSIATILKMPRNSIVAFDEIDNGIHTSALEAFWKAIVSAAIENDVQIFATTHSKESLEKLKNVLDENENLRSSVGCFTLVKRNEGEVTAYRREYEAFKTTLEEDWGVRDE